MDQDDGKSSNEDKKWQCEYCTFENWPNAHKCTMCRASKPVTLISGQDIYRLNYQEERRSSVSPAPMPSPKTPTDNIDAVTKKWSCPCCTYFNFPRSLRCTQCLNPRHGFTRKVSGSPLSPSPRLSPSLGLSTPPSSNSNSNSFNPTAGSFINSAVSNTNRNNSMRSLHSSCDKLAEQLLPLHISSGQVSPEICRSSPPPPAHNTTTTTTTHSHSPNTNSGVGGKWVCGVCTYENWPRSGACVICGSRKGRSSPEGTKSIQNIIAASMQAVERNSPSPEGAGIAGGSGGASAGSQAQNNNLEYEKRLRQLRRRMRETDWAWLSACMGVVEGDSNPVEAFLNSGGQATRKLSHSEAVLLGRPQVYEAGHTLVHLAVKAGREDLLARLLSQVPDSGHVTHSAGHVKRVPSYVAPDLAAAIRRQVGGSLRQRKGQQQCYYLGDTATFTLPQEIEDLPRSTLEQLLNELLDRDAQAELETELVINWSAEVSVGLASRLSALWNRSAGDCLLDAVLQASWGVFDRDNTLRRAISDSLQEAGHMFYPRWKEWEMRQSQELDYTLAESQWAEEWSALLALASQPGESLEQLHVFCLAHILRRPICVYGVKYVKSWRGENLGYAKFEGVYLPLLWDASFCYRSPLALGYTRGHFSALVPPDPDNGGCGGAGGGVQIPEGDAPLKSCFLPLMSRDRRLLPLPFTTKSESGREEEIMRDWMDVLVTESGLLVAQQTIQKPPLLVAQMTEEWLNYYRKQAQQATLPGRSGAVSGSNNIYSKLESSEESDS